MIKSKKQEMFTEFYILLSRYMLAEQKLDRYGTDEGRNEKAFEAYVTLTDFVHDVIGAGHDKI